MRRFLLPALMLALMLVSFAAGRLAGSFRTLPAMVATLSGEEAGFSREFDSRVRAQFPVGSSEDALIAYLESEKFAPEWRRRDEPNTSAFILSGLICRKTVRVRWRADASGALTDVSGAYESRCL